MRAVRFDHYGGPEVLEVREVDDPVPEAGEVLVQMRAASINPGEISIREGLMESRFPATFPSGEGSDLAGVVRALGDGVDAFSIGDEVCGWTNRRASHAELVAAPADQLAIKPGDVPWEVAGSLFVAPMAAYACVACRRAAARERRSWSRRRRAASARSRCSWPGAPEPRS